MPYTDSQELARERQQRIRDKQADATAAKVADMNARNVAGQGLFRDSRLAHLDDLVRVQLNAHSGHVSPHELAAEQARVREAFAPVLAETPDMPLDDFREIVKGINRPKLDDTGVADRAELLIATRVGVYETRADRKAKLAAVNAEVAATKPVLNSLLKTTGAGNSVPLARALLSAAADRATARQTSASRAKPFSNLPAPASARPAPPSGKLWPILPAGTPRR